jgi:hypothetical protein
MKDLGVHGLPNPSVGADPAESGHFQLVSIA